MDSFTTTCWFKCSRGDFLSYQQKKKSWGILKVWTLARSTSSLCAVVILPDLDKKNELEGTSQLQWRWRVMWERCSFWLPCHLRTRALNQWWCRPFAPLCSKSLWVHRSAEIPTEICRYARGYIWGLAHHFQG